MRNRGLIFGLLLAALPVSGWAQAPAPATNSPPDEHPLALDGKSTQPNNVPEIMRWTDDDDDAMWSKAVTDPRAALEPPSIESTVLARRLGSPAERDIGFNRWAGRSRPAVAYQWAE